MYLIIDNYDSFTYNLADLVAETGRDVEVRPCDAIGLGEIAAMKPEGIILSPGPKGRPMLGSPWPSFRISKRRRPSSASVSAWRSWPMRPVLLSSAGKGRCTAR